MLVEGFDAYCCEGLGWRRGRSDQNQGMTILDTLILTKNRFPADEKINNVSLSLLYPTSVQGFIRKALFVYFI